MEAFVLLDFYKNNIFADLTDTFPGNDVFAFSSKKAAETARSGNDQRSQAACFTVKYHLDGTAQAFAGTHIDDDFLF